MSFRAVLQRWREQPSGGDDMCVADAGGSANALLAELAADPEDFADLAAVLNTDVRTVVAVLASTDGPRTVDELVAALTAPVAASASASSGAPAFEPRRETTSLGGGGESGWGRWTRVRGGARVHPEPVEREPTRTARPAMAAS